ncbi:MAG TPA: PGPGW domain-containing protein, partial [Acidimicrobiales bacterium]|nr:PGPGW domain-containing protein [Acidimicrobiales bacterium]
NSERGDLARRLGYVAGLVWNVFRWIGRNGKRIAVAVVGAVLVLAGLVMMVTPGPGLLVIIAGLFVLGTEFVWAERALDKARERASEAKKAVRRRRR